MDSAELTEFGKDVLRHEAEAILVASERLDERFAEALKLIDGCTGKLIIVGMGKSGIAARKLAATLTSTGCPAIFLHPSEAMHGDLGIVAREDVVVAISNGGESEELLAILPSLSARCVPIIAIVGSLRSTLAQRSTIVLDATIEREACPLNLAPTTSVVVALALGDALAMTLEKLRDYSPEDYAQNHPGGKLGRRLTLRVCDVMPVNESTFPRISIDASLMDLLSEISAKGLGAACVTDDSLQLLGIITDYDIRKAFQNHGTESFYLKAGDIMNPHPAVTIFPEMMAYDALNRMEQRPRPVSVAPVVDETGHCHGMVRVHDFLQAGL